MIDEAKLVSADLDQDEDLDLFGVFDGHHLKWFRNMDGLGTFSGPQTLLDVTGTCLLVELADVDGDLDKDILHVSDTNDAVVILSNDGTGVFSPSIELPLPDEPRALTVADINGDGQADILVTLDFPAGAGVGLFAGSPTGFGSMVALPDIHDGPASNSLEVGDLDLVGGLDMILNASNDTLVIARNTSGNGLDWDIAPLEIPEGELTYPYRRPQLLDVDADGDLDIGEVLGNAVHWLRNDLDEGGSVTFTEHVIEPWTTNGKGAFGTSICSAGACLVYVPNDPGLPVRWNSYLAELGDFAYSNDLPSIPRGRSPLLADLNGDGRDDLVMEVDDALFWFPNQVTSGNITLELPSIDTLCRAGDPVPLPAATPAGGRWYGQQIFNGLLFRSNLPESMDLPVVHAVYPEGGCPLAQVDSIRIIEGPVIISVIPPLLCSADAPIPLVAEPMSVEWFGLDGSSIIDPAVWNGGFIVCQYTDATGQLCADVEGPIQRWLTLPAELAEVDTLCTTDPITLIEVIAGPPFNVVWEGPVQNGSASGAEFDPSIGPGSYSIILNAEPSSPNLCRNSDTLLVVVAETPTITFDPQPVYCAFGAPIDLVGAGPAGGVWSGDGVSESQLHPDVVGEGTHLINYFVVSEAGCSAQASTSVTLAASTTLFWEASDLLVCPGEDPLVFTAVPEGGAWGSPVDADGTFLAAGLQPGSYPLQYTYVDPRGCSLSNAPLDVIVGTPKVVTIDDVGTVCLNSQPFQLSGSGAGVWSGAITGEGSSVTVDPAALGLGSWPVTLTISPIDECAGEATVDLVVEVCTSVDEEGSFELSAAPLPFQERTTLRFGDAPVYRLEVFDATGKRVQAIELGRNGPRQVDLDLSAFSDGVYLLNAFSDAGTAHLRLVKAR